MPRRAALAPLPAALRAELHRRLLAADFGDLVRIAAWLTTRGYPIRKSALGAYAHANRAIIAATMEKQGRGPSRQVVEARLRCLDIAARTGAAATITRRARGLLSWVLAPDEDSA